MSLLYVSPCPTVLLYSPKPKSQPRVNTLEEYHNRDVLFRSARFKSRKKLVLVTTVLKDHYTVMSMHCTYISEEVSELSTLTYGRLPVLLPATTVLSLSGAYMQLAALSLRLLGEMLV